jgi:DNA (cytosine-5)-methyltransferase 1
MLRLLDTFSGIGGFSYAAERIVGGYKTVAFVEREPFCQKVLRKHWPDVPVFDDITTYTPERGSADVICGGFPCQDISTAGRRAGIKEGTRSGLFYELMRVIRMVEPRFIILENVSAILANGLDTVLGELAEAGFDAEWACIPASAVGACHQRDRWWLVAWDATGSAGKIKSHRLPFTSERSKQSKQQTDWIPRDPNCQDAANASGTRLQGVSGEGISGTRLWRKSERCLDPNWQGYLSEPVLRRGDDGLSNRVDRIKALGNSVVPQVAAIPLQRVLDLSEADSR